MEKKLTAKQELFCKEYLKDLNATQAAIRSGYSEKTAKEIGCENLTKPNIQKYIQEQMELRKQRVEISADDVLNDIIETRKEAAKEGNFTARLRANELLGKHIELFTDKIKHGGDVENPLSLILKDIDGRSTGLPEN